MWLFLIDGFYSVVQDKDDTNTLLVRARNEDDAIRMADRLGHLPIEYSTTHDYAYRIRVPRAQFSGLMEEEVQDIAYTNFKNEVHEQRGFARSMIYSRVWAFMLDALQGHPRATTPPYP
jgi:hypothetical protein